MQSIFLKIYGGIFFTVVFVVITFNSFALQLNQYRLENHILSITSGTFSLIEDALQRHNAEQQKQWLDVVVKLTNVSLKLQERDYFSFTKGELKRLDKGLIVIKTDAGESTQVYKSLSKTPSLILHTQLSDINEQLARLTALLILYEAQRQPNQPLSEVLSAMSSRFDFNVSLINRHDLALTFAQSRLLQRNEMVVSLHEQALNHRAIIVHAPIPGADEVLQVGPVELFEWAPRAQIYTLIFIGFAVITIISYLLIRPLQVRLNRMADEVDAVGNTQSMDNAIISVSGNDVLSHLGRNINAMSERIQSLLRAQKDLTQAVSHELRTPIARINFHLALLEEHLGEDIKPIYEKHIMGISHDADELEALVDEILSYATLQQSIPELEFNKVDLAQELKALVEEIKPIRSDIELDIDVAEETFIKVDAHYFMRACKNLLLNAQRYSTTRVQVSFKQEKGQCYLTIDDDGPGIPESDREHIFEPFKRLDASRNRASGGYGLGLAIVFETMRWHHGEVSVSDAAMGGSRFILCWPSK